MQQNPLSALNPRRSVGASIRLALDVHRIGARAERAAQIARLLEEVGLDGAFAARAAPRPLGRAAAARGDRAGRSPASRS